MNFMTIIVTIMIFYLRIPEVVFQDIFMIIIGKNNDFIFEELLFLKLVELIKRLMWIIMKL